MKKLIRRFVKGVSKIA